MCKYIASKSIKMMMILLCVMLTSYFVDDDRMNVLLKISRKKDDDERNEIYENLLNFLKSFLLFFDIFFW